MELAVCPYPGLSLQALAVELPAPLGDAPSPAWLVDLLRRSAGVRDLFTRRLAHEESRG